MPDIESQQQDGNHRPRNSFPLSITPHRQDIVLHDTGIPSVTGTGQLHLQWEDVHATVGNNAVQDTLWDTHYTNVVNHGAANYPELASDLASPHTHPNVGPAHQRGIPEPMQVMSHENPGNDYFGCGAKDVVPGSIQAASSNPSTHLAAEVGQPAAENLRRLASRYIYHPDSQVDMVRMEPGPAGRCKVVIVLEMADFL